MTTVYLAGKMRGVPYYNFPAFDSARDTLQRDGYTVISPADLDREHGFDPERDCPHDQDWNAIPHGFDLMHAIERDYQAVKQADELCLLPGWQTSRGACAEKALAEWMGKRVWEFAGRDLPWKRVIGLVGYATSGKDTAADGLIADGSEWQKVSFSDPLWDALWALNPLISYEIQSTGMKLFGHPVIGISHMQLQDYVTEICHGDYVLAKRNPEVRRLLQKLGTEAGRDIHGQDCWVNIARRKIQQFSGNSVIVNVRFNNEADMIVNEFGGDLIYVHRPGVSAVNGHVSDANIDNLRKRCLAAVTNDGTPEQLQQQLKEVVSVLAY